MKILVHYAFTDEQVDELRTIATEYGHYLYYAADETAAIEQVPGCECLLGLFNENVTRAGDQLRWIQSFSVSSYLLFDVLGCPIKLVAPPCYVPKSWFRAFFL